MPFDMVRDAMSCEVTPRAGKGALGIWRSRDGQRRESEEPSMEDEPDYIHGRDYTSI
jgi:hypothetical protein